jgi:hypothetical protein
MIMMTQGLPVTRTRAGPDVTVTVTVTVTGRAVGVAWQCRGRGLTVPVVYRDTEPQTHSVASLGRGRRATERPPSGSVSPRHSESA